MGVNGCELLRKKSVTTCCPSPYNTLNNGKKEETEAKRIFISAFKDTPTFKSVGIAEAILEEGAFDEKMKKRLGQYEKGTLNKKVMSETGMRSKFKRIAEIADQAAENMEKRFGSYDSTAELIDRGVAAVGAFLSSQPPAVASAPSVRPSARRTGCCAVCGRGGASMYERRCG
eukprot:5793576-Prymnesium_polylepis.1